MRNEICPDDHKHGETPTCYRAHKCSCVPCCEANTERGRARQALLEQGLPTSSKVPVRPVQEHITDLLVAGIPRATTAAMARVTTETLFDIESASPTHKIYPATANKILAVDADLDFVPGHLFVTARGVQRRIRALAARGWSVEEIARRLEWSDARRENIYKVERVRAWVHQTLSALYEEIWNAEPPATTLAECAVRDRTIRRARQMGWAPPMAWDDIDADEAPDAVEADPDLIDEVAVELALRGHGVPLSEAERQVVIEKGTELGMSAEELAERVHRCSRTVQRLRQPKEAAA